MSASCYTSHTAQDSYILLPEPNKSKRNTDFHGESEAMQILPLYLDGDLVEGRESNDAEAEETWFAGTNLFYSTALWAIHEQMSRVPYTVSEHK